MGQVLSPGLASWLGVSLVGFMLELEVRENGCSLVFDFSSHIRCLCELIKTIAVGAEWREETGLSLHE